MTTKTSMLTIHGWLIHNIMRLLDIKLLCVQHISLSPSLYIASTS